tara:strand:+ start:3103 stop:3516 length:414 start_codon:yes stop_codon:yes gene_type:complete
LDTTWYTAAAAASAAGITAAASEVGIIMAVASEVGTNVVVAAAVGAMAAVAGTMAALEAGIVEAAVEALIKALTTALKAVEDIMAVEGIVVVVEEDTVVATMAEGARAEGIMAATSTMGTAARTTIPIIICTGRTTT